MMDYRYNNKIITDVDKQIVEPTIVLCTRGGKKIGVINNVQQLKCNHPMSDTAEISFDIYKEVDGIPANNWDLIKDFKFIYLPTVKDMKYRWYEITVNIDEGNDTIKHVTGIHANEAELGQLMLYEVEINTANDIARDDYEIIKIDNKEYGTVFYNPEHPKASLLHRILSDKASHYSILHVDDTLKNLQREFSFNGTSIVDALRQNIAQEIGCLFVFGESDIDDNEYHRTISAYDLMDYCTDCKERGNYTNGVCTHCGSTKIKAGYGHDTGIFINVENLSDSISYSSNTDQVKNFFKLTAGDEDMTAAIRNCNPSGSNYLCYFSDEIKEDMSDELRTKVTQYMNTYDSYLKTKSISLNETYVSNYNNLINKYQSLTTDTLETFTSTVTGFNQLTDYEYNALTFRGILQTTLMPASEDEAATTAAKQLAKLTTSSMSPIGVDNASAMSLTAADTAVESYAKVYVDTSRYKIELANSSYSNKQWTGTIIITSYTEDTDTAQKNMTLAFNNDAETFTKQKIKKLIKQHKVEDIGDVSFLENPAQAIKDELKKYSLDALSLLDDLCVAVMDILTEAGYAKTSSEYYNTFYKPYFDKRKVIIAEEKVRETEIKTVQKMIDHITNKKKSINNALDLENYFGDLYSELMLYRRDSEYNNSNFISDGMDDSEIIKNAKEYFKRAQEELLKASTPQHTISASLYDLFMIPEFRNIVAAESDDSVQYFIDLFESGNWIRIQVDDKVYKLRLVNWEIDYTKPENLDVEFSDAIYTGSIMSDVSSVLSKARSMATSYDATVRQAEKGTIANQIISETQQYGFVLNKNSSTASVSTNARPARKTLKSLLNNQNKIINDIDNQNFVIDSQGALMRAKTDFEDTYSPEQIKLLNKGIYYTNDDWETVKAGLGHFSYIDPETGKTKEDYGIIASTIIGQLILGNDLKIYSESGKFEMGDEGLVVTAKSDTDNTDLFVIQKQTGDNTTKYFYIDADGNVQINGSSVYIGGLDNGRPVSYVLDDARKMASNYLSADQSGIMIADLRNGQQMPSDSNLSGRNVLITSTGVDIRNGTTSLAEFGSGVRIGENSSGHMTLDTTGIKAYKNASTKYFEVGDGSTLAYQTYIVQETPLSVILSHPIVDITSVVINGNTIDSENYTWSDDNLTIIDRPKEAINSMSVTYIYYITSSDDDSDYDTATITETITEKYDAISLTVTCQYNVSYISSINISPSSSTENKITYNVSPPSGTEIDIVYRLSDSSPYFTFDNKNGKVSFSSGGAATGISSFITGIGGTASGLGAFVAGRNNIASGGISTALGNKNTSKGYSSFSGGEENIASGGASFAIGYQNNATNSATFVSGRENKSTGAYSASLGWASSAGGQSSFACGRLNKAVGDSSTALGYSTKASGFGSFSCGRKTIANAEGSSAMGYETIVNSKGGLACGRYNRNSSTYLFSVGNGSSTNRSNALTIKDNGSCCIAGSMYSGTNFGSGNYRKMFKSANKNGTTTVGAKATKQFSFSIGETGYTPWAIGGLHSSSSGCNIFRFEISGNDFIVSLYNPNSEDVNVTVYVNIKYIATDAL